MAMEMKGKALTRDRLQPTVWRLTRSVYIRRKHKNVIKKAQKGHFGVWDGSRLGYLSRLSFVSVWGRVWFRSVYMVRVKVVFAREWGNCFLILMRGFSRGCRDSSN
jgi:hypothetical protein